MADALHCSCPFCGSTDLVFIERYPILTHTEWLVRCRRCMSEGPSLETPELAAAAWDLRVEVKKTATIGQDFDA